MKIIMMVVFIMTAFKVWAASPKGANIFFSQKKFFSVSFLFLFYIRSFHSFTYFKNVISILPTYLYRKEGWGKIGDEKNDGFDIFLIVDSPTLRDKEEKKAKGMCPVSFHYTLYTIYTFFWKMLLFYIHENGLDQIMRKSPTAIKKRFIFAMSKFLLLKRVRNFSPFFLHLYLKGFIYNDFSSFSLFLFIYLVLYIYGDACFFLLSIKILLAKLNMYLV